MGDVDVYLNGKYVQHLFGRAYHEYTRFEIALEDGHIGENVFAARLHKITDDNTINFDIMIQLDAKHISFVSIVMTPWFVWQPQPLLL